MVSASGSWRRLGGHYAEALVALDEAGSGGVDTGFGVAGNGGVAVDDEIVVREDGMASVWAGVLCP